ncbi:MAG: glycoside hydrolase [Bacteroidales bacterium]|nr:glycoside hydrolase [Bacteroidales bacterium]
MRIKYTITGLLLCLSITTQAQNYLKLTSLYGEWKFTIGDNKEWAKTEYNDSKWEQIKVPSAWEDQGFNGYDGFAWYRKKFTVSQDYKNEQLYLNLGYIDDCDEVYINGSLIGFTGSMPPRFSTAYNSFRIYFIPKEIISFDKPNTLAVRVYDSHLAGGIVNGDVSIAMQNNPYPLLINLYGLWKFIPKDNSEFRKPDILTNNWSNITVPKPWEDQGYQNYDGFGWYSKRFYVSGDYSNERLVVVLGKIDDFEEVYLNGEYIGPLKKISESQHGATRYNQFRAYYISGKLLKANQYNIISVRVLDTGGVGGIYEGPVGISKQSDYVQYWKNRR